MKTYEELTRATNMLLGDENPTAETILSVLLDKDADGDLLEFAIDSATLYLERKEWL